MITPRNEDGRSSWNPNRAQRKEFRASNFASNHRFLTTSIKRLPPYGRQVFDLPCVKEGRRLVLRVHAGPGSMDRAARELGENRTPAVALKAGEHPAQFDWLPLVRQFAYPGVQVLDTGEAPDLLQALLRELGAAGRRVAGTAPRPPKRLDGGGA